MSATRGTSPVSGTSLNSTPPMVSLEQMCTNFAPGVSFHSETSGMVEKLESLDVAATLVSMYLPASASAFLPHAPVTMKSATPPSGARFIGIAANCEDAPPCRNRTL